MPNKHDALRETSELADVTPPLRAAASAPKAELTDEFAYQEGYTAGRVYEQKVMAEARAVLAQAAPVAADEDFGEELAAFLGNHTRLNQDGIDETAMRITLELNDLALRPVPAEDIKQWREDGYMDAAPVAAAPDDESVAEDVYNHLADMIAPYVAADGQLTAKYPFPASVTDTFQMLLEHYLAAPAMPVAAATAAGWAKNTGVQPVADDVLVAVIYEDGSKDVDKAGHYAWEIGFDDTREVGRYYVLPAAPTPESA